VRFLNKCLILFTNERLSIASKTQIILGEKPLSQTPSNPGSPPSTPRWVKVFIILFIAIILLVVVVHLMGFGFGGNHGMSDQTLLIEHAVRQL
jgi:hypothetical protein